MTIYVEETGMDVGCGESAKYEIRNFITISLIFRRFAAPHMFSRNIHTYYCLLLNRAPVSFLHQFSNLRLHMNLHKYVCFCCCVLRVCVSVCSCVFNFFSKHTFRFSYCCFCCNFCKFSFNTLFVHTTLCPCIRRRSRRLLLLPSLLLLLLPLKIGSFLPVRRNFHEELLRLNTF